MEHRPVVETRGKLLLAYAAPGTELTVLQDEGLLELTRRQKVLGWDDEVESTHEIFKTEIENHNHDENDDSFEGPPFFASRFDQHHATPRSHPKAPFVRPRQQRFASSPSKRSGGSLNFARPVSFSTTYSKIHPGTTGVAVLEQMERLDAVEASLKKLGGVDGDNYGNPDREEDVAESATSPRTRNSRALSASGRISRFLLHARV